MLLFWIVMSFQHTVYHRALKLAGSQLYSYDKYNYFYHHEFQECTDFNILVNTDTDNYYALFLCMDGYSKILLLKGQ